MDSKSKMIKYSLILADNFESSIVDEDRQVIDHLNRESDLQ